MKKLSIASVVLMSLVTFSLTACQAPAPQKDGICAPANPNGSLPSQIDPDCPATPAK